MSIITISEIYKSPYFSLLITVEEKQFSTSPLKIEQEKLSILLINNRIENLSKLSKIKKIRKEYE